jgi:hypothetical protein
VISAISPVSGLQVNETTRSMRSLTCAYYHTLHVGPIHLPTIHNISVGSYHRPEHVRVDGLTILCAGFSLVPHSSTTPGVLDASALSGSGSGSAVDTDAAGTGEAGVATGVGGGWRAHVDSLARGDHTGATLHTQLQQRLDTPFAEVGLTNLGATTTQLGATTTKLGATKVVCPEWEAWGACSVTCGSGVQHRRRARRHRGCGAFSSYRKCTIMPCARHCAKTAWGGWSQCSRPCGGGTKIRFVTALSAASVLTGDCPSFEQTVCSEYSCFATGAGAGASIAATTAIDYNPSQCNVGEWSSWGHCSHNCGVGVESRTRTVSIGSSGGASSLLDCPVSAMHRDCRHSKPCADHCKHELDDASMLDESSWTPCTVPCGGGTQIVVLGVGTAASSRSTKRADMGGADCPFSHKRMCNVHPCPEVDRDCELSGWGAWGECSHACGGGCRERHKSVVVPPRGRGRVCGAMSSLQDCNPHPCPARCRAALGPGLSGQSGGAGGRTGGGSADRVWSEWSPCSRTCGSGVQVRVVHLFID